MTDLRSGKPTKLVPTVGDKRSEARGTSMERMERGTCSGTRNPAGVSDNVRGQRLEQAGFFIAVSLSILLISLFLFHLFKVP